MDVFSAAHFQGLLMRGMIGIGSITNMNQLRQPFGSRTSSFAEFLPGKWIVKQPFFKVNSQSDQLGA